MCCANRTLLIFLVVFIVLAFFVTNEQQAPVEGSVQLFPVSDFSRIEKIEITPRMENEALVIVKGADGWILPAMDNFGADVRKIQELVYRSSQVRMGDKISSGDEFLVEYGLVREGELKLGTKLAYFDGEGKELAAVILGNDRLKDGMFGKMPSGQYVRPANEKAVYLIAETFRVDTGVMDWVYKQLPELKAEELVEVHAKAYEADGISLRRENDKFKVPDLKETEEMDETTVKALAGALESFAFTELVERDSAKVTTSLTAVSTFTAVDKKGVSTVVELGVKEQESGSLWGTISWKYSGDDAAVKSTVDSANRKWQKWAFAVSEFAGKSLFKNRDELVREKAVKEEPVTAEKVQTVEAPEVVAETVQTVDAPEVVAETVKEGKEMQQKETPTRVEASHILIAYKGAERSRATRTKEEAVKLATDILDQIKAGKDLSELAPEYSDCPSGADGGALGAFGRHQMAKPFEDAAFGLAVGETTPELVETVFGYHIIKRTK
jgi:hypothetical protein